MNQSSPFEAIEETLECIRQVEEHATDDWKQQALNAVEATCRRLETFISDDVWESGLKATSEDRALGPMLIVARKAGWCQKTDRVRSSKRSHMSGKPVWRSLIYKGEQ